MWTSQIIFFLTNQMAAPPTQSPCPPLSSFPPPNTHTPTLTMSDYDTDDDVLLRDSEYPGDFEGLMKLDCAYVDGLLWRDRNPVVFHPTPNRGRFIRFMDLTVGVRRLIGEFVGHRFFTVEFRMLVKQGRFFNVKQELDSIQKTIEYMQTYNTLAGTFANGYAAEQDLHPNLYPYDKHVPTREMLEYLGGVHYDARNDCYYLRETMTFFRPAPTYQLHKWKGPHTMSFKDMGMQNYTFHMDNLWHFELDGVNQDWNGYKVLDIQAFGGQLHGKGYLIEADSRANKTPYVLWYQDVAAHKSECPAPYPGLSGFPTAVFAEVANTYPATYYPLYSMLHLSCAPDIDSPHKHTKK